MTSSFDSSFFRLISTEATLAILISASLSIGGCSSPPPAKPAQIYPGPESYLVGKNIEAIAQVYGNPTKSNTVGKTTFISYTGIGRTGSRYSNICFLEIQADRDSGVVRKADMGSNLEIDSQNFGFDVRQDCNRRFYTEKLAH